MSNIYSQTLQRLATDGNLRSIPSDSSSDSTVDFSTNDYLGLGSRTDLSEEFFADRSHRMLPMSSSASRLLAAHQASHAALEALLAGLYGRDVLLFNSGYHANTGMIPALAAGGMPVVADRLVHASIIDGMVLTRGKFTRFPHNDAEALGRIVARLVAEGHERVLVVTESVFSMDGDRAPLDDIIQVKRRYPQVLLYIDEAHAFGALGERGLGLAARHPEADVIMGTFGKAAASAGAFAAVSPVVKQYLVNRARSFIFSTALPPMVSEWTRFMVEHIVHMDSERDHLAHLAATLHGRLGAGGEPSHILPLLVGDAAKAVELSQRLLARGFKVLPIRTPTVPPGTERLRISLSAAMDEDEVGGLAYAMALES